MDRVNGKRWWPKAPLGSPLNCITCAVLFEGTWEAEQPTNALLVTACIDHLVKEGCKRERAGVVTGGGGGGGGGIEGGGGGEVSALHHLDTRQQAVLVFLHQRECLGDGKLGLTSCGTRRNLRQRSNCRASSTSSATTATATDTHTTGADAAGRLRGRERRRPHWTTRRREHTRACSLRASYSRGRVADRRGTDARGSWAAGGGGPDTGASAGAGALLGCFECGTQLVDLVNPRDLTPAQLRDLRFERSDPRRRRCLIANLSFQVPHLREECQHRQRGGQVAARDARRGAMGDISHLGLQ